MKHCPSCRIISPDSAERCDCGYDFVAGRQSHRPIMFAGTPPCGPRGVGGWLLLLCVGMAILAPILSAVAVAVSILSALQSPAGPYRMYLDLDAAGLAVAGAVLCYAGFRLWAEDRRGPRLARWALVITLLAALLPVLLLHVLGLAPSAARRLAGEGVRAFLQTIPGTLVWLAYLRNSKRVRATYGDV